MQMTRDISTLEASEPETFANFFFLSSNLSEFGKYKRPLSPALIPISSASDTLLSWKNDAVDFLLQNKSSRVINYNKHSNFSWSKEE